MRSQLLLGWSSGSESLAPMIESQSACPGGNLVLSSMAQVVVVVPAKLLAVTYSKTSVAKAIWYSQSQVCGLCQTKARWQEVDQSQVAVGSSGKWQPKSLMVVPPRRNCRRRQLPGHRWPIRPRTHNQGLQSIITIVIVVRTIMDSVIKGCLRFDNGDEGQGSDHITDFWPPSPLLGHNSKPNLVWTKTF